MQTTPNPNQQAKKMSIIIVDDEPDILSVFKKSLELAGHSTYGFVNPSAALAHFSQNQKAYDLIITDIRMPGMSGFEFARAIRNMNKDVRIILMTSFEINMKELKTVLPSLKIDGVVQKPMEIGKLRELVETATKQ